MHSQSEDVDDLLSMEPQEMRSQNAVGSLLDQDLVASVREGHPPRGVPVDRVLVVRPEVQALCPRCLLVQAHPRQGWSGEDHAWDPGVVRRVLVTLQQIAGDYPLCIAATGVRGNPPLATASPAA